MLKVMEDVVFKLRTFSKMFEYAICLAHKYRDTPKAKNKLHILYKF